MAAQHDPRIGQEFQLSLLFYLYISICRLFIKPLAGIFLNLLGLHFFLLTLLADVSHIHFVFSMETPVEFVKAPPEPQKTKEPQ